MAVASSDGIAVIAGDSIQNAMVARERRNALVFWNDKLATRSISKLLAIGDVIYPGHDLPFRLTSDGHAEYLHDMELTLTGIEAWRSPGSSCGQTQSCAKPSCQGSKNNSCPARSPGGRIALPRDPDQACRSSSSPGSASGAVRKRPGNGLHA